VILATDIDFDRDGKQVSAVRVPIQREGGADGALLVPIAVIRNGDGPTLFVTAGNHGDEYEGQVAAAAFVRPLDPAAIRGRVIIAWSSTFVIARGSRPATTSRISPRPDPRSRPEAASAQGHWNRP
jgi:predicted deacylase